MNKTRKAWKRERDRSRSWDREIGRQRQRNRSDGLVSLFNGISTFVGYLMPKPSFQKNSNDVISLLAWRIVEFITFPKGICPEFDWSSNSRTTNPQSKNKSEKKKDWRDRERNRSWVNQTIYYRFDSAI